MRIYFKHILLLVKRLIFMMILMSLTRLLFFILNFNVFGDIGFWNIVMHFVYGLRFDMVSVVLINSVFIILSVFPVLFLNNNLYQKFLKIIFVLANSIALLLNIVDSKFFEFEGKRLTADYFSKIWIGNDFVSLLPSFFKDYWYLFILVAFVVFVLVRYYPKNYEVANYVSKRINTIRQAVAGLVLVGLFIVLSRGGVQLKPLGILAAAKYTSPENIELLLNSPFTVLKTIGKNELSVPKYFSDDELTKVYTPIHQYHCNSEFRRKNVVIIILESFGREYSGYLNNYKGYTPCFDSIMRLGLTFENAYANGRRSLEALPSIFSSIPSIMDYPFISSPYTTNSIEGIARILGGLGYETSFFHGGKNGTMGFDNFVKLAGVKSYYGLNEYPDKKDFDGHWGIFDEAYLSYFCDKITEMKKPFFTSVFTLSSHHPYWIPDKYKGKFPKGNLVNLESIGYADHCLGEFFRKASTKPWFNNTLFVLSADHTAQTGKPFYESRVGRYAIPIVFYAPGDSTITGLSNTVCQQADIFPSVMDYLNYNKPFVAFGNSVFDTTENHFAISYAQKLYQIIYKNVAIGFDGNNVTSVMRVGKNSVSELTSADSLKATVNAGEALLKGVIQQFYSRITHNKMMCKPVDSCNVYRSYGKK